MRVFLSGVSCVGKSTLGKMLAERHSVPFFDLDHEIETYFGESIERLQKRHITINGFREEASQALVHLLAKKESADAVIALTPSGFLGYYWRVVRKAEGLRVVLSDAPQHILSRITFYDEDSHLTDMVLSDQDKTAYLREIKRDISYFKNSYSRAHLIVDLDGLPPDRAVEKLSSFVLAKALPSQANIGE